MNHKVWRPLSDPIYKRPWRFLDLARQLGHDVKWMCQRVWKGYCDYDLFSIDDWFMRIMPEMLKEYKETRHGSPVTVNYHSHALFLDEEERNQAVHHDWDEKLDRMIFLLGEMDEFTCSQQNPYEDEYFEVVSQHRGILTENEDGSLSCHYPDLMKVPECRELCEQYRTEEKRLAQYRLDCKKEFFELFSTHFYDLWD